MSKDEELELDDDALELASGGFVSKTSLNRSIIDHSGGDDQIVMTPPAVAPVGNFSQHYLDAPQTYM
jgi:hypothetical protein